MATCGAIERGVYARQGANSQESVGRIWRTVECRVNSSVGWA